MKIGLVSWPFYGYGDSIRNALTELGHEVLMVEYTPPAGGNAGLLWYSGLRRLGITTFVLHHIKKFGSQLFQELTEFKPNLVLFIKGDFLLPETIGDLKQALPDAPFVLWLMDPIETVPEIFEFKSQIDYWFFYEPDDIVRAKKRYGLDAHFLPLVFDPRWYHPLDRVVVETDCGMRDTDVSFAGALTHLNRRVLLDRVCRTFQGRLKFTIVSPYYQQAWRRTADRIRGLRLPGYVILNPLDHTDINKLYQTSKINLNIHREEPGRNLNMRFFEILGAGGLQLVEQDRAQNEIGLSEGDGFATYSSIPDLFDKIRYFIQHPDRATEMAARGAKRALTEHSFLHRMQAILHRL